MQRNFTLKLTFLLFLLFLIIHSTFLIATVRYVSKTGLSIPPYTSWLNAADSIQKCIDVCVFGDTIYVANGVYQEQVVMIPGLSLIGGGTDSCIVDGRNFAALGSRAIEMMDSCLVKGFYILATNNFDYGYGIYTEAETGLITENKFSSANTPIVLFNSNVEIYKNYCFNFRRGIGVYHSNSSVRKNTIIMNDEGATGIRVEGFSSNYTPVIDSNDIQNVQDKGIYKFFGTKPTIKNNVIDLYYAYGIVMDDSDSAKVFNNVIYNLVYYGIFSYSFVNTNMLIYDNYIAGPGTSNSYGILLGKNSVIKNNVVTNTNRGISAYGFPTSVIKYNNSWNNTINYVDVTPDTTNLSVDPMVVNDDSTQGDLDFHLQMFSPLIDAGDPNILDKDSTRSDIGLYGGPYGESYVYVDLPPRSPVNLTVAVDTLIKLNWNKNTEADFSHYNLYRDTVSNFQIDSTKLVVSLPDTFYNHIIPTGVESLYFKLTAVDNQENESNPSEEVGVLITSVKDEWKALNNYVLYQNYPNPFNPSTKIGYKLKERGYVKLYVYDIKGELVSVLVNQIQEAGYYEVEFYAEVKGQMSNVKSQLASGVYIYQIFVSNDRSIPVFSDIKKMVYVK